MKPPEHFDTSTCFSERCSLCDFSAWLELKLKSETKEGKIWLTTTKKKYLNLNFQKESKSEGFLLLISASTLL